MSLLISTLKLHHTPRYHLPISTLGLWLLPSMAARWGEVIRIYISKTKVFDPGEELHRKDPNHTEPSLPLCYTPFLKSYSPSDGRKARSVKNSNCTFMKRKTCQQNQNVVWSISLQKTEGYPSAFLSTSLFLETMRTRRKQLFEVTTIPFWTKRKCTTKKWEISF